MFIQQIPANISENDLTDLVTNNIESTVTTIDVGDEIKSIVENMYTILFIA